MKFCKILKFALAVALVFAAASVMADLAPEPTYSGVRMQQVEYSTGIYLAICISVAIAAIAVFFVPFKNSKVKRLICIGVIGLLALGAIVFLVFGGFARLTSKESYVWKCPKCGSVYKESELTGSSDEMYFIRSRISGDGRYKYDCPKCSGWHPHPPRLNNDTVSGSGEVESKCL